jgi:hypothetical protein
MNHSRCRTGFSPASVRTRVAGVAFRRTFAKPGLASSSGWLHRVFVRQGGNFPKVNTRFV